MSKHKKYTVKPGLVTQFGRSEVVTISGWQSYKMKKNDSSVVCHYGLDVTMSGCHYTRVLLYFDEGELNFLIKNLLHICLTFFRSLVGVAWSNRTLPDVSLYLRKVKPLPRL